MLWHHRPGCHTLVGFGYSLVFGKSSIVLLRRIGIFFLAGVTSAPNTDYAYWVSQNVYAMYQLMFATHHSGAHRGGDAERMKYWTVMLFIAFWMFLLLPDGPHGVGNYGFMNGIWNANHRQSDRFAGGTVVI